LPYERSLRRESDGKKIAEMDAKSKRKSPESCRLPVEFAFKLRSRAAPFVKNTATRYKGIDRLWNEKYDAEK
jgi:hypothetical protein